MTTKFRYTPRGVKQANDALTEFLLVLKDFCPTLKYVSGMDAGKRKLVHFNIAIKGTVPSKRRLKDLLHEVTGPVWEDRCYDIKVKAAHSNVGHYLAKRASELPNIKDSDLPAWRGVTTKGFRRIRTSIGLFPAPPKRAEKSPWRSLDTEYIELLQRSRSMTADTATPREAGDTADQSSLTGVVHGHEGERRGQGVLVQDVRTRAYRRRSVGDTRELDENDEAAGRAVVGASQ